MVIAVYHRMCKLVHWYYKFIQEPWTSVTEYKTTSISIDSLQCEYKIGGDSDFFFVSDKRTVRGTFEIIKNIRYAKLIMKLVKSTFHED